MMKIKQSRDGFIFMLGMPTLIRRRFYVDTAPWLRYYIMQKSATKLSTETFPLNKSM